MGLPNTMGLIGSPTLVKNSYIYLYSTLMVIALISIHWYFIYNEIIQMMIILTSIDLMKFNFHYS